MSDALPNRIRETVPDDVPPLVELAIGTGVFKPHEITALEEVFRDFFAGNAAVGHRSFTIEQAGNPAGFVYCAPASMADRAWYVYWIAVARDTQARGLGSRLLEFAERDVAERGGRLLLVETSSLDSYAPTRRFYARHGYEVAATIADFYTDGDSMVVFAKRLLPRAPETPRARG